MGNQKIPKDQPEALTYACRIRKVSKYQRGNREIPKGQSGDTKGQSRDTKGAIRRYQRGNQEIPKGQSVDTKGAIRSYNIGV
jgi:LDH2 family malate/lactate/ureidoglycolate dehydrogenase